MGKSAKSSSRRGRVGRATERQRAAASYASTVVGSGMTLTPDVMSSLSSSRNASKGKKIKIDADFASNLEDAFLRMDRNKLSVTQLRKLVHILEERSKRDH